MRLGQLDAVEVGHQQVEDGDVELLARRGPSSSASRGRRRRLAVTMPQRVELKLVEDPAVRRVVVDDEDAAAARGSARGAGGGGVRQRASPRAGTAQAERAALAGDAGALAVSEPSINSARRRLIARPRPVPPYRREIDASTWLNDWKRRPIRSGGMPMPVSRTSTSIVHGPPARRRLRRLDATGRPRPAR